MYRRTQFGTLIVSLLGASILIPVLITIRTGSQPVLSAMIGLLCGALFLFHSLTVEITSDDLIVRFGPGLIRKRFSLQQIRDVAVVRNRWYYGWGIRFTPHGWLYTVSGLDAVQIRLENGKQYRIGTNHPIELSRALVQALSRRSSGVPSP